MTRTLATLIDDVNRAGGRFDLVDNRLTITGCRPDDAMRALIRVNVDDLRDIVRLRDRLEAGWTACANAVPEDADRFERAWFTILDNYEAACDRPIRPP